MFSCKVLVSWTGAILYLLVFSWRTSWVELGQKGIFSLYSGSFGPWKKVADHSISPPESRITCVTRVWDRVTLSLFSPPLPYHHLDWEKKEGDGGAIARNSRQRRCRAMGPVAPVPSSLLCPPSSHLSLATPPPHLIVGGDGRKGRRWWWWREAKTDCGNLLQRHSAILSLVCYCSSHPPSSSIAKVRNSLLCVAWTSYACIDIRIDVC